MTQKPTLSSEQNIAANPNENIWVQANAGTGKTSVLVQRLLRIMFRCRDLSKTGILCLTYTNAAAGEMRNRILKELKKWASVPDSELAELLHGISEKQQPDSDDVAYARKIFYVYIDNPDILKIKTIHGFCEEILHRFPLEAGVSPAWSLVPNDIQNILLQNAFDNMINDNSDPVVSNAFSHIVERISEYSMSKILSILSEKYKDFFGIENNFNCRKQFVENTKNFLNINIKILENKNNEELEKILYLTKQEQDHKKTPVNYLETIIQLTRQYIDNIINFDEYKCAYLNQDGSIKKIIQKHDFLVIEQQRVFEINQYNTNKSIFDDTIALFDLSSAFAKKYQELKQEKNLLDFDDLILYTRKLFSNPETMGWVLSQLDVSLSHILLDEAQDTSPAQWDILRMLSGDFFTDGNKERESRSLFVVGDTKQSIYGFMGADPKAFAHSRADIASQIQNNLRTIREIPLTQSFRSLPSVLWSVDTFFDNENIKIISNFANNKHNCYRKDGTGIVEINKLISKSDDEIDINQYIKSIAQKIKIMIDSGQYKPSDIMILVQKRTPMASPMVSELKRLNIPVAGSDRIVLPNFPAIRDLLNLVRFCIDTTDDYSLCCVLKSPLYRFSESDIYNLCTAKNKSESATVFDILSVQRPDVYEDLLKILEWSKTMAPYSFFSSVLNDARPKMIAALGDQIIDPLEEFMTICLAYERTQPGTLKHFLKWFITGGSEIKRDMDASSGVRVMTIHGSKGLQSRVVFLIDTVNTPNSESILDIPNTNAWLWLVSNQQNTAQSEIATQHLTQLQTAEYYRLLYVAMTRACDELYIYGWTPHKNAPMTSWHNQLWNVFSENPDVEKSDDIIRIIHE